MAATLVGSLIAPSIAGMGIGIFNSPKEYDAIAHLARYVGWLMGVDNSFLPNGFRDSVRVLYHTSAALSTPDETTPILARPMIEDPSAWHYPRFTSLRRRIARSQHLGITAGFLGRGGMAALGISQFAVPWYPIIKLPINLLRSIDAILIPGGRERAARRGARSSAVFMRTMTPEAAAIGEAAHHITHHAA